MKIRSTAILLACLAASEAHSQSPILSPERPVVDGITTRRLVPGAPYELAGKRIVFTNWYYIQPGDLDWRDAKGKSVYVHGDRGCSRPSTSASTPPAVSASSPRSRTSSNPP